MNSSLAARLTSYGARETWLEDRRELAPTDALGEGTSPSVTAPAADRAGERLGRYLLTRELGRGSMGSVFRAIDPRLDRIVAIKVLHARRSWLRRFGALREARAMARVNHPNVVKVFDVAETDQGAGYVVMDLIAGPTLRQVVRQQRTSWREVVVMLMQAGWGLAAAHATGLIHRDFKPHNVLVGPGNRALVTDFGLARHRWDLGSRGSMESGNRSPRTPRRQVQLIGTVPYMAPELLSGSHHASAASDQYAFCVSLWEALVGRRPFPAPEVRAWAMKASGAPAWPRSVRVPRRIRNAIRRGLCSAPSDRWPDMVSLLDALESGCGLGPRRRLA